MGTWHIVRDSERGDALAWFVAPETTEDEAREYANGIGRAYVQTFTGSRDGMLDNLCATITEEMSR